MGKGVYFYAVHVGTNPGVYTNWSDCEAQIKGVSGAKYKKFKTNKEAEFFVKNGVSASDNDSVKIFEEKSELSSNIAEQILFCESFENSKLSSNTLTFSEHFAYKENFEPEKTCTIFDVSALENSHGLNSVEVIYTDGASRGNGKEGARAGFGVFFGEGDPRNVSERLQGTRQTNQRAELMAAIRALEKSNPNKIVEIRTDSVYLVRGVTEWIPNWLKKGWVTNKGPVENRDLFELLYKYVAERALEVRWVHVPAHSGIIGNELADQLAVAGAYLD